jgi:hypothetical protein
LGFKTLQIETKIIVILFSIITATTAGVIGDGCAVNSARVN